MTDAEALEAFEARIARGEKIEAGDWMPLDYRQAALKLIQMHAQSELMGCLPEREWIARAPGLRRKLALTAKVQDECGHAQLILRVAEDLGAPLHRTREAMMEDLIAGRAKYHNVFHYPVPSWADVGVIAWLVDGAAVITQGALLDCSYGPYGRILERICAEEAVHIRHGEDIILSLASGDAAHRQSLQDALNRWWRPLLHFFGPPDELSHAAPLYRYGMRKQTNEELRQKFLGRVIPQIRAVGLDLPDPAPEWDGEKWVYGDPDWEQWRAVINGKGPMSAERLGLRRLTWEEGRWIREAMSGRLAVA
ncbi:MAG TPA: 1,2-phenylacetyl-CoA epoxidase subunit PaaA [Bacillota bacterium]|nr:1,2-phenylacetyl-CoA epoxidase subunit PaaA [Bacillota bacterium]